VNDVQLDPQAQTMAKLFAKAGYDTAVIGKWHVDGRGREAYIPQERHQGFQYWKVLECTHNYNHSPYYAQNDPKQKIWDEYDAFAQTKDAQAYIAARGKDDKPFLMFLSWGPPHNPYETAPKKYQEMFKAGNIIFRPNIKELPPYTRNFLAGYYAHCVALDDALGDLLKTLEEKDIADNTIVLFTSDHGDMLHSQGEWRKQRPWDESIRVPFLVRYPDKVKGNRTFEMPINTPDILPTLLGLSGLPVPATMDGKDYSTVIRGEQPEPQDHAALIACYMPFGEWLRKQGGREYRGIRTPRYTYVRTLEDGPWLLFDNANDPYQLTNLINTAKGQAVQKKLERQLTKVLKGIDDAFEPGMNYIERWNYPHDNTGMRLGKQPWEK
jgi:arylsulfatase A-like enzyme